MSESRPRRTGGQGPQGRRPPRPRQPHGFYHRRLFGGGGAGRHLGAAGRRGAGHCGLPPPNGQEVSFAVSDGNLAGEGESRVAHAVVVKDAGDDPDATDGAHLTADVRVLPGRAGTIELKGVSALASSLGRAGPGHWRPGHQPGVPRRNIRDNVVAAAGSFSTTTAWRSPSRFPAATPWPRRP